MLIIIRVATDPKCVAPEWWAAARARPDQPPAFTRLEVAGSVRLVLAGAHGLRAWARELPGWTQPEPHPHPLTWTVDND